MIEHMFEDSAEPGRWEEDAFLPVDPDALRDLPPLPPELAWLTETPLPPAQRHLSAAATTTGPATGALLDGLTGLQVGDCDNAQLIDLAAGLTRAADALHAHVVDAI